MKLLTASAFATTALCAVGAAQADVILEWDVQTHVREAGDAPVFVSTSSDANLLPSTLTAAPGLLNSPAGNGNSWFRISESETDPVEMVFDITPEPGTTFSLDATDSIVFDWRTWGNAGGIHTYTLTSSLDNFTLPLDSWEHDASPAGAQDNLVMSFDVGPGFVGMDEPVTFLITGTVADGGVGPNTAAAQDSPGPSGIAFGSGEDYFRVNGTTAIPEPASLGLLATASLLILRRSRRHI